VALVVIPRSVFMISEHDRKVMQTIEWILSKDPNASILTQHDIFPYVSSRANSYVIPDLFVRFQKDFYFRYVRSLFNQGIDYVILDLNPDFRTDAHYRTYSAAFRFIEETQNYGLYASVDGVLVYKWHYNGSLVKFEPFTIYNKFENLEIIYDTVLFRCTFPKGKYNVILNVEASKIVEGKVFSIMITQGKNVLTCLDINGSDFKSTSEVFIFSFNVSSSRQDIVIQMVDVSPYTQVYVRSLDISLLEHFQ